MGIYRLDDYWDRVVWKCGFDTGGEGYPLLKFSVKLGVVVLGSRGYLAVRGMDGKWTTV